MSFKEPMLAGKCEDIQKLAYPVYASAKLDGVRFVILGGRVMSRKLKPIPNAWVQKQYGSLPEGTDGELIYGDPTHPDAYRNTMSAVMSEDGEPKEVCAHIFDNFLYEGGFAARFKRVEKLNDYVRGALVVPHTVIMSAEELEIVEAAALDAGYEGIMIRSMNGPYKQGRSTAREGYLLKVKRFEDAEAVILDSFEWESNTNSAQTSATGHTERSSAKAGMVGMGVLGGFEVRGVTGTYEGVEFKVGSGFQGADDPNGERGKLWRIRETLKGRIIKFKYFPTGSKDKPRFPTWLGFRDPIDF